MLQLIEQSMQNDIAKYEALNLVQNESQFIKKDIQFQNSIECLASQKVF